MIKDEELLQSARRGKLRKGQKHLIKHLEGGKITRKQAIQAKCYDCNGMGELSECDIDACPLLPFSPFNRQKRRFYGVVEAKQGIVEVA